MSEGTSGSESANSVAEVQRRHRGRLVLAALLALGIVVSILLLTLGRSPSSSAQSDAGAISAATETPSLDVSRTGDVASATPETSTPVGAAGTTEAPAAEVNDPTTAGETTDLESETGIAPPAPNSDGVLPDPVENQAYEEKRPIPTVESATATPPAAVPFDEATAPEAAEAALRAFVQLADQSYQSASIVPPLENVGGGFALGEVQTGTLERWTSGVRQVGDSVLVSVDVVTTDLRGPPPQVTLRACLDSSGVDALDAAGNSLKGSMYNPGHPVPNVYGVQYDGQAWKVTTHEIPEDETACGG